MAASVSMAASGFRLIGVDPIERPPYQALRAPCGADRPLLHMSAVAPTPATVAEQDQAEPERGQRMGLLLAVCCAAQFMVILDLSIVNVALPSIQLDLGFTAPEL